MKKKLIIAGVVLAGLFIALLMLPPMLIDENEFAKNLTEEAHAITGYPTSIAGVEVSALPPTLTIKQFAISNHPNASSDRLLLVDQMVFRLGVFDLLQGKIVVRGAEIVHPVVELEVFADGTSNYAFMDKAGMPGILKQDSTRLTIIGGLISRTVAETSQIYEIQNINANVSLGGTEDESNIALGATIFGKNAQLNSTFKIQSLTDLKNFSVNGNFEYIEEGSAVKYSGITGKLNDSIEADGTLSIDSVDVVPWFARIMSSEHIKSVDALQTPLPVKTEVKITAKDTKAKADFTNLTLAKTTTGKGSLALSYGKNYAYSLDLDFTQFDLFEVFKDSSSRKERDSLNHFLAIMLPSNVTGSVEIKAEKAKVFGADGNDFLLSASLEEGELVVNQSYVHLPGDSQAILFGILKPNEEGLIHLDGSIEFYGKDFSEFIAGLGYPDLKNVIKKTAPFRGKANLFFSDQQSTLSEFKFQAADLLAVGGMTMQTIKGQPTVEMTLKTSGLRLDPFFSLFTPVTKSFNVEDQLSEANRALPWLNQVRSLFLLNLSFDDFELGSFKGSQSTTNVTISPKRLKFDNIVLAAGDLNIAGNLSFDQTGQMPDIDANLDISKLSLMPFLGSNLRKVNVPRGNRQTIWPQETIDLAYLRGFTGDYRINVRQAIHSAFTLDNLTIDAQNKDGTLSFKNLQASLWGGGMRFTGTLEASSVNTLQGSFYLDNVLIQDMMEDVAGLTPITGRMNMTGQVATTGMNADGWVKNAQMSATIRAGNVTIQGFDLQGLIQAISAVRSVADVVNTSRVSMLRRETTFNQLGGSLYLKDGILRANEMNMQTNNAVGKLLGEMDVVSWMTNIAFQFKLTSLSTTEFPTVVMALQDSADNPVVKLDTRSLEAFVATRSIRR